MTRIPSHSVLPDFALPAREGPAGARPASVGPSAASPGAADAPIAGLRTLGVDGKRSRGGIDPLRREETRERLGRLRTELARIRPLPDTAEAAREAILMAMARAGLTSWSLPGLRDAATLAYRDGSRRLALISHAIILNPWGAFRIVDLRAGAQVYFELAGAGPRDFVAPRDRQSIAGVAVKLGRKGA
ncbi:hypothetical protein F3J18_15855 [Burkholderia sp. Ax-1720]|uniref:hypothetical protein n=1 Tax=Burkholderia sp. Ax-1720 TaxID=2608335 RepID=UPI001423C838|nr:hypothetical protein [Burkholderia sp. Ax-1720]NIF96708.1 hypothetical protein [Burkholderia sp. Ax-1720]